MENNSDGKDLKELNTFYKKALEDKDKRIGDLKGEIEKLRTRMEDKAEEAGVDSDDSTLLEEEASGFETRTMEAQEFPPTPAAGNLDATVLENPPDIDSIFEPDSVLETDSVLEADPVLEEEELEASPAETETASDEVRHLITEAEERAEPIDSGEDENIISSDVAARIDQPQTPDDDVWRMSGTQQPRKSRAPFYLAGLIVITAIAIYGYSILKPKKGTDPSQATTTPVVIADSEGNSQKGKVPATSTNDGKASPSQQKADAVRGELEALIRSSKYKLASDKIQQLEPLVKNTPAIASLALTAELMLKPDKVWTDDLQSPTAVNALSTMIRETPDWKNRYRAVQKLGQIADAGKFSVLVAALENDKDWMVRATAAMALKGRKDNKIVESLKKASQSDPELPVRLAAEQAILP